MPNRMQPTARRGLQHPVWPWLGGAGLGATLALAGVALVRPAPVPVPTPAVSNDATNDAEPPTAALPTTGASSAPPGTTTAQLAPTESPRISPEPLPEPAPSTPSRARRNTIEIITPVAALSAPLAPPQPSQAPPAPSPPPAEAAPTSLQIADLPKAVRAAGVTYCGTGACDVGNKCCCDHCVPYTATCPSECEGSSSLSLSVPCGMQLCDTGLVCCNASCGICAAPGKSCSEKVCN